MMSQAMLPQSRGPFRALVISFHAKTNVQEFKNLFFKLTLEHPNYSHSEGDKHKIIINYKYAYDVANLLEAHKTNSNIHINLFYDKLSRTLHPKVLYVQCTNTRHLRIVLINLGGDIIYQTSKGTQIKFKTFQEAAIAHEELREQFQTKFAYKTDIPVFLSTGLVVPEPDRLVQKDQEIQEHKLDMEQELRMSLENYKSFSMELKRKFVNALMDTIQEDLPQLQLQRSLLKQTSCQHKEKEEEDKKIELFVGTRILPEPKESPRNQLEHSRDAHSEDQDNKEKYTNQWVEQMRVQTCDKLSIDDSEQWQTDYSHSDLQSICQKLKFNINLNKKKKYKFQ